MKLTISETYTKQIPALIILTLLAIIIWHGSPFVPTLHSPEKRFFLISLLFFAWFLKFMFIDTAPPKTIDAPISPENAKKLDTLKGRFFGAIEFLKKTIINKHGKNISLSHLPWYLLVGTNGSGKTTLLANSNINFILAKQFKPEQLKNLPTSSHCDWWATRDAVLVDVPGNYFGKENFLWNQLLNLVGKRDKIHGAVITLQLPELMKKQNQQQKKQIILEIKQRIIELRKQFGESLPFQLVITKCDLLPGFVEFFNDSGSDELTQNWGITLSPAKENEKIHEIFSSRFNSLIRRLNKQLIWRLHQERNANARPYIKDFPLHVERLKEGIAHFIKSLMIPNINLQGVFLTSATQQTDEESNTLPATIHSQALALTKYPDMQSRAFFVRQLLLQGFLHTNDNYQANGSSNLWRTRSVYAASVAVIITSAVLLGRDFQQSIRQVYSLQNELNQYQLYMQQATPQENHLTKALPLLNALRAASHHSTYSLSRFADVLSFYTQKSQQTANTVYAKALQTIIQPEIKNYFEKYLRAGTERNPDRLYMILKAYMMLSDPQNFQSDFVMNTIHQLMPNVFSKADAADLESHVVAAFKTSWQPIEVNESLVDQARRQLTNLPASDLAFVILKNTDNNNSDSALSLGTNSSVFVSKQVVNRVPNMFTAAKFQKIYSQEIATAATESLQGNLVLGIFANPPSQESVTALIDQIRNRYLANYVDIWESLLANIQPATPKNLSEMSAMVSSLTSSSSPLLQLLQTIQQNTSFSQVSNSSPKLQALQTLLVDTRSQQNALYQIFVTLRQLDVYLQTMVHSSDIGNAAFLSAKNRAQNSSLDPIAQLHTLADTTPDPIKSWMNTIATQSWKMILQESGTHINHSWQTNVSTTYQVELANRYPFNQNATQEVDLHQFSQFMGQQGTFANFYQTYLKPFVNDSEKKWQWKIIDNQKLPFADATLEQIQQAWRIQRAFFPNGDNKLYVQFTLEPVNLDSKVKNFNLTLNGQQVIFQKNTPRILAWPGENHLNSTSINFITTKNQLLNSKTNSDWAWFRLVTQSTHEIISTKQLLLEFNVNGHYAKYYLFTQGHMNPFLPLNLSRFEFPNQLT